MLLSIENVGKILNASFRIDGITIIAGDNNTGKSTVGKILYCLYRGFFDEPEIHLHPEWQLAFAEVIVLLQKEFDLSIVVTTHSAYFLFAVEVFSAKHEIKHNCNYYLAEAAGNDMVAAFADVTDNLEPIYAKYFKPFQELENMRWSDA